MPREQVVIRTADGECPTSVFTPGDGGPWPAAIFFMDGLGIRPVLFEMGQRLADAGFVVLLTPKAGHPDHVDASEIEEAAVTAGLHTAGGASVSTEWSSVRLVAPRGARR